MALDGAPKTGAPKKRGCGEEGFLISKKGKGQIGGSDQTGSREDRLQRARFFSDKFVMTSTRDRIYMY